jgi:hypothetical protein
MVPQNGSKLFTRKITIFRRATRSKIGAGVPVAPLRLECAMSLKWIGQRLKMGTWTYMPNCLGRKRNENKKCQ